ncbi:MAG: CapA family protein, partial [Myxococcota bacterium]
MASLLAGCAGRSSPDGEAPDPADDADAPVQPTVGESSDDRDPGAHDEGAEPAGADASAAAPDSPAPETRLREPPESLPDGYLAFDRACEPGQREITIAAVGDLLIHRELQRQAFASSQHFRALWSGVESLIAAADVSYANLEGPTAQGIDRWGKERKDPGMVFDNKVYSGYARFNYHPAIVTDLVASGFDIVSTANNHSLDRGPLGVDRTIDALNDAKLPFTGTRKQAGGKAPWHAVTDVQGIAIAWLACTLHTNYQADDFGQVLRCF